MSAQNKLFLIFSMALLLLTIILGMRLSLSGKPYNTVIFSIHKLAGLGAVVLSSIGGYNLLRNTFATSTAILLIIAVVSSVLALFITGALMSVDDSFYSLLKTTHIIATFFIVASIGGTVFMAFHNGL